ncbi:MAG: His-Xaa-Ser system protein HxsD [Clostridiales bacterium 43-6]|nr:MAG: His-Xaa-Ser system protein HxsD [Clostridiales bacterium 43-6]
MQIKFSKELYPKFALIKTAYAFTNRAYVHLDTDGLYYVINWIPRESQEVVTEGEFMNEMLTQCARYEILKKTRNLRELLAARAIASTMLDMSGISKEDINTDNGNDNEDHMSSEDEILRDWFEENENSKI